jgi:drug/metabolite transporter (DMT)-like permease
MDFTVVRQETVGHGRQGEGMTRRAAILFTALGVAWGIPYLLIKVAVEQLSPLSLVLGRTLIGAIILLPLAFAKGVVRPVLRHWLPLLVYTLVEIVVPWVLLSNAEQRISSSLAGLLIAAVPFAGVGVAFVTGARERLGRVGIAGLLAGFAGVAFLVGLDVRGSAYGAVAAMGVVVLCYASGAAMLGRWLGDLPGLGVVATSVALAALIVAPFAVPSLPTAMPSTKVVLAVLGLGVICTAAAMLLLFALVREIGPVRATTITYVNPLVAVVAGALVLGERVTIPMLIGFALILAGCYGIGRARPAAPMVEDPDAAQSPAEAIAEAATR